MDLDLPGGDGPLLVTADAALREEVLRACAAAGVVPSVVGTAAAALAGWARASAVLLGADLAPEVAGLAPPRRGEVHVLVRGEAGGALFRAALAVGAQHVAELPQAEAWLVGLLGDLAEPDGARGGPGGPGGRGGRGVVVGVLGGSGGAGATTFACALAQVAARHGPAVLLDLDPLGPGADRVLGAEGLPGLRWGDLGGGPGRLGARALREALPRGTGPAVLAHGPARPGGPVTGPPVEVVRSVLDAAARGHRTTVLDLPRVPVDPVVQDVLARCTAVVVVAAATLTGAAAALRLRGTLPADALLVVRGRGADPDEVAEVTGLRLVAALSDQRGLDDAVGAGLGPLRGSRTPLARAAAAVLAAAEGRADGRRAVA